MINFLSMFKRSGELTPTQERDVLALVQSGQEVQAVRLIRRHTDAPLGRAVGMVASLRQQLAHVAGD